MKSADEAYEKLLTSVPPRQLNRSFDSFGAAVAKIGFLFKTARSNFSQLFRKVDHFLVVEISVRVMQKTVTLILDCGYNFWMSVTDVEARYSSVEIDVLVSINIFHRAVMC